MRRISSRGERGGEGGFALYELILALAILGLVAGIVFPRIARPPGPAELRVKAQEVAALLRSDRNAALRGEREVVSHLDLEAHQVRSGAGSGLVEIPSDIDMRLVQSSLEVRADGGGFRFNPDGGSSGGVLTLRRGPATYEVSVNWLTAAVLVGIVPARTEGATR